MSNRKQRLELTWIGKDNQPKLEPRILIEDAEKSYGDKSSQNMLLYGDNLLALKALEQDFSGKTKCIYIDPPFNTGQAFLHYAHSITKRLIQALGGIDIKLVDHVIVAGDQFYSFTREGTLPAYEGAR